MKKHTLLQVLIATGLLLSSDIGRADSLDDLVARLRSGTVTAVDPAETAAAYKTAGPAATRAYQDGIADLYLSEIKLSIADPNRNGGWPYRSFLLDRFLSEEDNTALRRNLTTRLKERFAEKPEAVLAYALVCPAIFAADETLVDQAQAFLKDNDPFLFKLEQDNVGGWRSAVKAMLARDEADVAALREIRFGKLSNLFAKYGHDIALDSSMTTALGLTEPGQSLSLRQLSVDAKNGSPTRGYMRTADGGFLLLAITPASFRAYRATARQAMVAAVEKKPEGPFAALAPADAAKELSAELAYWLSIAEKY